MHLVSDATGETLNTVGRAAAAYYSDFQPIEHVYALVRTSRQLDRVIAEIERQPGIVLFTIADATLRKSLEDRCQALSLPCLSILDPVIASLATYLNSESRPHVGGQHVLDAEYFRRIDALNFTMAHDDGQHQETLDAADVRSRLLTLNEQSETDYVNRELITLELIEMRKLCARQHWPLIDVTRRSIEETAAAVLNLLSEKRRSADVV
ncbi:MAG: kinase/pyrophosphorylase [Methylotetracoccus sp.]|nr:kinase/pyrophosphorylase [Methylotetracoccus sp.]